MSNKKIRSMLFLTAIWLLITIVTFFVFNKPQCPDFATHAQIKATGCIVGPNIGLLLVEYFIFLPGLIILLGTWIAVLYRLSHSSKK